MGLNLAGQTSTRSLFSGYGLIGLVNSQPIVNGGDYQLAMTFNDSRGLFVIDSVKIGDYIWDTKCDRYRIVHINSLTPFLNVEVTAQNTGSGAPNVGGGNSLIYRGTKFFNYPLAVQNINDNIRHCVFMHQMIEIDEDIASIAVTAGVDSISYINGDTTLVLYAAGVEIARTDRSVFPVINNTSFTDVTINGDGTALNPLSNNWNMPILQNGSSSNSYSTVYTLNDTIQLALYDASFSSVNDGDIRVYHNISTSGLMTLIAPTDYTIRGDTFLVVRPNESYVIQLDTTNQQWRVLAGDRFGGGGMFDPINNTLTYGVDTVQLKSNGLFIIGNNQPFVIDSASYIRQTVANSPTTRFTEIIQSILGVTLTTQNISTGLEQSIYLGNGAGVSGILHEKDTTQATITINNTDIIGMTVTSGSLTTGVRVEVGKLKLQTPDVDNGVATIGQIPYLVDALGTIEFGDIPVSAADSTRYQNGIIVSWIDGTEVDRDTLWSDDIRFADNAGNFIPGQTVDWAIERVRFLNQQLAAAVGVSVASPDMGTFPGAIYADNSNVKALLTTTETTLANIIALTGVPINSTTLGTFAIPGLGVDNTDIKSAIFILASDAFLTDQDKSITNEGRLSLLPTYSGPDVDRVALRSNTPGTKDIIFVPGTGMKYIVSTVSSSQDSLTIINNAPDVPIVITDSGVAEVTGTYPNFNVHTPAPTAATTSATPHGAVTGTDVQAQLEQLRALIPGVPVSGSNVLFVSKGTGNNATGKVGSILLPFRDPWAARDTAIVQGISNPVVIVTDGSYTYGNATSGADRASNTPIDISLYRPNHTYYSYSGVSYSAISDGQTIGIGLFTAVNTLGFTTGSFSFLGESSINTNVTGGLLGWLKLPNADITIEASNANLNTAGGANAFLVLTRISTDTIAPYAGSVLRSLNIRIRNVNLNSGRVILIGGNSSDTITNFTFNINFERINIPSTWVVFGAAATHHSDCNYNMNIGVVSSVTTAYLTANNRAGFINSSMNVKVGTWFAGSGTAIPDLGQQTGTPVSTNGQWRYTIDNMVGNLRFIYAAAPTNTQLDIYVTANISSSIDNDIPIIDIAATSYPNVRYFLNLTNLNGKRPLVRCINTDSEITLYNSIYRGTKYAISATAAGRTAPINVYNSYLSGALASTVTSNTVPINVAQSNFTITDAGLKNIIREREIGEPIWRTNTFTATSAQTTFTTTPAKLPISNANVVVVVDGLEKDVTTYYTYVAATGVITFVTPMTGGEVVKVRWYD